MKIIQRTILSVMIVALLFAGAACTDTQTHAETVTVEYLATTGGSVWGETTQTVEKGADASKVTAVADDGYVFVRWSDGKIEPARQETAVEENISITATFEKAPERFSVTYFAATGGLISGAARQTVTYGKDAKGVYAMPNAGYEFETWSDGLTSAYRQDTNITQDFSVTARFTPIESLSVVYRAGKGGRIEGETEQTLAYDGTASEVTAVPEIGYRFVKWSDTKSTDPTRTDAAVKKNVDATAEFAAIMADGSGTTENPRLITDYAQLLAMRQHPDLYYKLDADLDLSGQSHRPIFDENNAFSGSFDGGGYTIRNMKVDASVRNPSLFGCIETGIVENLNLADFEIILTDTETEPYTAGAVAGESRGVLDRVEVNGIMRWNVLSCGDTAIGGLAGRAENIVSKCRANVAISAETVPTSSLAIGGLVGAGSADLTDCEVQGSIYIENAHQNVRIGGLVGSYVNKEKEESLVRNCVTNVAIRNGDDSAAVSGGLIASVRADGSLQIYGCGVKGDIDNGGVAGGLIAFLDGRHGSSVSIAHSYADNDMCVVDGAGLIRSLQALGLEFTMTDCRSEGRIAVHQPAVGREGRIDDKPPITGFCSYILLPFDGTIKRCGSTKDVQGGLKASGFACMIAGGNIEECFSAGTVTATSEAAGFAYSTSSALVQNCYSVCDVTVGDPLPEINTYERYIGGFIAKVLHSTISHCYYAGQIDGQIVQVSGEEPNRIAGEFVGILQSIGNLDRTHLVDCHLLHRENSLTTDAIAQNTSPESAPDLTVYYDLAEMKSLTEKLNEGALFPVWVEGEDGLPQFLFTRR